MRRPAAALASVAATVTPVIAWRAPIRAGAVDEERWVRLNYRQQRVSLLLGPAVGMGVTAGALLSGVRGSSRAAVALALASAVGGYDDLYGDAQARGLAGHLRALSRGQLTTGLTKAATLSVAAAIASYESGRDRLDIALGVVLIAGSSNLLNLLDLRPGRAAKAAILTGLGLMTSEDVAVRRRAAPAMGVAVAALPPDLAELAMLGDTGAAALGLALGWAFDGLPTRASRTRAAAVVVGATLLSERVSFSKVIHASPPLRWLDELGRQDGSDPPG